MTSLISREGLGALLFGLFAAGIWLIFITLYIPLLPRRVRVFNERCKRRFLTIFKGFSFGIPNGAIVVVYLAFCFLFAVSNNP